MPFYHRIDGNTEEGRRILSRLLELRAGLDQHIPDRTFSETLLLATWNIRDFDKPAYGPRVEEAIYYIAEIINRFDIVAVQEVYEDLSGLKRVMEVLGSHWKYIVTDSAGKGAGNFERMTFLYDSRKVVFGGLAGEIVLPPDSKDSDGNYVPVTQFWRTPMMVGFKSGWTDFILTTVHILWDQSKADPPNRVREVHDVTQFLKGRSEDPTAWSRNIILLGDFNIFGTDDETFRQITDAGFEVPEQLLEFRSNASKNRHYDQIAFRTRPGSLDLTGKAGVFDYYDFVFRNTDEDREIYRPYMGDEYDTTSKGKARSDSGKKTYYSTYWRTHQMSDHLPMWVELRIDYSDEYLKNKLERDE